jgi:hypothetical protein
MGEDSDNHRGILDGGKGLQVAAAVWTVFNVDLEDALEQTRPTHAAWRRAVRSVSSRSWALKGSRETIWARSLARGASTLATR